MQYNYNYSIYTQQYMLNIKHFLKEKDLEFANQKQAISWVKRSLAPKTLLKIGPNYMIDQKEMEQLYNEYVKKQKQIQQQKQRQAQAMTALNKKRKEENKDEK